MNRISNNSKVFFVVNLHNASCFIAPELNGVQGVEGSNPFIPTRDLKGIHGNMNSLFSFLTAVFPLSIDKKPDSPVCKFKKSVFLPHHA